jgi:hypothetical protein
LPDPVLRAPTREAEAEADVLPLRLRG